MSAVKKIGIVVTIGVIISVAYYFLNKSKPKIVEEQLAELETDTVSEIEEQLVPELTVEEQLLIDKCLPFKTRGEIERCKRGELTFVSPNPTSTTTTTPTRSNTTTPTRSNTTTPTRSNTTTPTRSNTTTTTTTTTPTRSNTTTTSTPTPNVGTTPTRVYSSGRRL
jgi:hypothetical protein